MAGEKAKVWLERPSRRSLFSAESSAFQRLLRRCVFLQRQKNEAPRGRGSSLAEEEAESELEFEDPYGDDFEVEDVEKHQRQKKGRRVQPNVAASASAMAEDGDGFESTSDEDDETLGAELEDPSTDGSEDEDGPKSHGPRKLWRPGVDSLQEGEVLEFDSSAYDFFHKFSTAWPCLSFDFVPDGLGANRTKCPHTCFLVGGTQAGADNANVLKAEVFAAIERDAARESGERVQSDEDEEGDGEARLDFRLVKHEGVVNRLRVCPQLPRLVGVWSESGVVSVFDVDAQLRRLEQPDAAGAPPNPHVPPKAKFGGHGVEGFALDWNPIQTGRLLSGDVEGGAFLWEPREGGWSQRPLFGGSSAKKKQKKKTNRVSLEELQWRPGQNDSGDVFAAAFSDGCVKVFDLRSSDETPSVALPCLHASDVNALRYSPLNEHLLLTGDEEGALKVTDLRCPELPLANLTWHRKPITSVSWHPTDEAVFAAASLDNSLSVWDLSVERDEQAEAAETRKKGAAPSEEEDIPAQLMFLHGGQEHISEIHFHKQIPGCLATTASDGFNIFKTCNV